MHVARVTVPITVSLASGRSEKPASPPTTGSIWPSWLRTLLTRRMERRQLLALDERDLRDIGLTPSEARALAQEPLWRR